MKKKLLSILLIGIFVIGLTGCGSETTKKDSTKSDNSSTKNITEQDKNIKNIKEFLKEINNKDFDKAVTLLDKEGINELLKISLPSDEFSKSLNHTLNRKDSEIKYDTESIEKISKEELLDKISKMNEKEILKNRKDIIDLFDDYDLYIVKCDFFNEGEKISMHDLVFVNDSKLGGTVFIDGLISYYYGAVYNRPNS